MVKYNSTEPLKLEVGAEGVAGHAGLWQMGQFVDKLGVGELWSQAFEPPGRGGRRHDRGRMLVQAALMLTGGGEACTDIEYLRAEPGLFGDVASDSTLYRLLRSASEETVRLLTRGLAAVRSGLWNQLTDATEVVLDIDSSVHEIHSDNKQAAARSYKGVYGFHPIYCFWDATGECLSALLRPGNAAANKISDHTTVLDEALAALPEHAKAGGVRIRVDSAGSRGLAWECRQRQVGFSMGASRTAGIQEAISHLETDALAWEPALPAEPGQDTEAQVAEATHLVDMSEWPPGTRLIIRRERRHPGAQRSLFPSDEYRYWGHRTDQESTPAEADLDIRRHYRAENHIARLKDSGGKRFPFQELADNQTWLTLVILADALALWFQRLCLKGTRLERARPKTMRWVYWHTPARIIRHARRRILQIPRVWPAVHLLSLAHQRILSQ